MSGDNQTITQGELLQIRTLDDFDLIMLISEVHDHGWPAARALLVDIIEATTKVNARKGDAN